MKLFFNNRLDMLSDRVNETGKSHQLGFKNYLITLPFLFFTIPYAQHWQFLYSELNESHPTIPTQPWYNNNISNVSFPAIYCEQINPDSTDKQYFPNLPGCRWVYECIIQLPTGTDTLKEGLTIRISEAKTNSHKNKLARWEVFSRDTNIAKLLFGETKFDVRENDAEMILYPSSRHKTPIIFYHFPLNLGSKWNRRLNLVCSVDSLEDIIVPAGKFTACKLVTTNDGWWQAPVKRREWIKEGVGIIRLDYSQTGLINNKFELILKSYHIGGLKNG